LTPREFLDHAQRESFDAPILRYSGGVAGSIEENAGAAKQFSGKCQRATAWIEILRVKWEYWVADLRESIATTMQLIRTSQQLMDTTDAVIAPSKTLGCKEFESDCA
jgi:hypothetical protein